MEKIVVGIDGSGASKDALRWAVDEARVHGARVVALHAWEMPPIPMDVTPAPPVDLVTPVSELEAGALQLVRASVAEVLGDESAVEIEPLAEEGPAAPALIEAARDADLLVVGSHGHGALAGVLLGSVSQECVQNSRCPVLIHRTASTSSSARR
jgi:nucleotide-binding universal stress UspA family protein